MEKTLDAITTAHCADCGREIKGDKFTPGYGIYDGRKLCYGCCALQDLDEFDGDGPVLYVTKDSGTKGLILTNWPGSLTVCNFTSDTKKVWSNFAGRYLTRVDVWFYDLDGRRWHGYNIGDNDVLHMKRTKHTGQPGSFCVAYNN